MRWGARRVRLLVFPWLIVLILAFFLFDPGHRGEDLGIGLAGLALATAPADTAFVLHSVERDVTGDGEAEIFDLVGTAVTPDSLEVLFRVRGARGVLYEERLRPLTRMAGFDGGSRELTGEEYQAQVSQFGRWFLAGEKFMPAGEFEAKLRASAPAHAAAIGDVIARRSGGRLQAADGARIWRELRRGEATVFEFSPGGDMVQAIVWSEADRTFHHLLDCC